MAPPISTHRALVLTRAKRASSDTIDHLGDARKVELPTRPGCSTRASPSVCTAEFNERHCEHVAVIKAAKLLRDAVRFLTRCGRLRRSDIVAAVARAPMVSSRPRSTRSPTAPPWSPRTRPRRPSRPRATSTTAPTMAIDFLAPAKVFEVEYSEISGMLDHGQVALGYEDHAKSKLDSLRRSVTVAIADAKCEIASLKEIKGTSLRAAIKRTHSARSRSTATSKVGGRARVGGIETELKHSFPRIKDK
ncbi:hypothetical protein H9P43_009927 [Blastocladiella emersonii ATCC 22665]|nr:hypothetical protein H9P43_009927 [Blastocladiella emersonii ATCC 22665]